jgi:hypothetical protein
MNPLTISIDLDKTWTADPTVFALITHTFRARGHRVIICTRRGEENLTHEERIRLQIPEFVTLFFANLGFKRDAVPFHVDIWIDDEPGTIEPQRLLEEPSDSTL